MLGITIKEDGVLHISFANISTYATEISYLLSKLLYLTDFNHKPWNKSEEFSIFIQPSKNKTMLKLSVKNSSTDLSTYQLQYFITCTRFKIFFEHRIQSPTISPISFAHLKM